MWKFEFEGEYEEKDINVSTTLIVDEKNKEIGINCTLLRKEYVEQIKKVLEDYKDYKLKILGISFHDKDIDLEFFCEHAKDVEKLRISNLYRISFSNEVVEFLKCFSNIKSVTFFIATSGAGIVDFKWFPKLEELEIEYWKNAKNVFELENLRTLKIWHYPYRDFGGLSKFKKLECLELIQTSKLRNFKGSEGLSNLKYLGMYLATRLESLEGIEGLKNLEQFCIKSCGKPKDLTPVRALRNLKFINIDKVKSVKPLEGLDELRCVFFDTIEDSDVSVLFKLPKLEKCFIESGSHYSERELARYIRWRNPAKKVYSGKLDCLYF